MRVYVGVIAIGLGAITLSPLACGGNKPDPNDPSQMQVGGQMGGQFGQPGQPAPYGQYGQPGQMPAGGAYPQGVPTAQPTAPVPQATPQGQPGGGSATAVAPGMAAAVTPALTALAGAEVRGMQPEGGAFAAQFQEGQTFEQPFNIQPGKCYAVVGVGVGIQELDLQIATQPAPMLPAAVLAQDQSSGPSATLGGKGQCFKNPLPIGGPAKVIMKASKGGGLAIAQIYVK